MAKIEFTDEVIQKIFGNEAAEDENPERLREYYFKNETYSSVIADLPLRILVGHKGIGKSALFTVAASEDWENNRLPIIIKPDDIETLSFDSTDPLKTIRDWKEGLTNIIFNKVMQFLEIGEQDEIFYGVKKTFGNILGSLSQIFKKTIDTKVDITDLKRKIIETYLKNVKINVYIDDVDRGWTSSTGDIRRLSALLIAIRDLARDNAGLFFKLSLRSDVYFLIRTSDESTDKIEGSVIWHRWSNQEILILLVKRIETFMGNTVDEKHLLNIESRHLNSYLEKIMDGRFSGHGKWENVLIYKVLMSLIRKRPRDLVKLCTLAAREAYKEKSSLIRTNHFKNIFVEYSQGRMQDTVNEYKSELPEVERLLLNMKPTRWDKKNILKPFVYTTNELRNKIKNITEKGAFKFTSGKHATVDELANFIYKINFITARKELDTEKIDRKYFEENRYVSSTFVDFGYDWEIHPAYRWVLEPDNIDSILSRLDL